MKQLRSRREDGGDEDRGNTEKEQGEEQGEADEGVGWFCEAVAGREMIQRRKRAGTRGI